MERPCKIQTMYVWACGYVVRICKSHSMNLQNVPLNYQLIKYALHITRIALPGPKSQSKTRERE